MASVGMGMLNSEGFPRQLRKQSIRDIYNNLGRSNCRVVASGEKVADLQITNECLNSQRNRRMCADMIEALTSKKAVSRF